MSINLWNFIFVSIFLFFCARYPKAGIIITFLLLLGLPLSFTSFGFSIGEGEKYLPNLLIIELFYTFYYFLRAGRKRFIVRFDIVMIGYIGCVSVVSLFASHFSLNYPILLKQFMAFLLFYFMGKVYVMESGNLNVDYDIFRKFMLGLAIYMLIFYYFEYFTNINIHDDLQTSFVQMVGYKAVADQLGDLEQVVGGAFYRIKGPLVEPTESSIVLVLLLIFCITWSNIRTRTKRVGQFIVASALFVAVILSGTRISMLTIPPVYIVYEIFARKRNRLIFFAVPMILLVIIFLVSYWGFSMGNLYNNISFIPYFSERLLNDNTFQGRLMLWQSAWPVLQDNYFLGIGVGTPVNLVDIYGVVFLYTVHNFYLDIIIFRGVIGGIFLLVLWFLLIKKSFNILARKKIVEPYRDIAISYILFFVVLLVFGLSSPEKMQVSSIYWFFAGVLVTIESMKDFNHGYATTG